MFPRLIHIYGPLWIHGYGFMIAMGFLLFTYLFYKDHRRKKIISDELFFNSIFLGLVAGILGGRLFFVFYDWQDFSNNWLQIFYPWVGGFGVLGTIIGVLIVITIYLKINKINIFSVLDVVSIYAPLMQSVARIGCFLAGCCYGKPAASYIKWAVTFSNKNGLAPLLVRLHPAQLYSSLLSFLIFLILYFRTKYFSFKKGEILFLYLILESISRFTVDFWRGNRDFLIKYFDTSIIFKTFSYSQLIAILIFIFSLAGFIYVKRK